MLRRGREPDASVGGRRQCSGTAAADLLGANSASASSAASASASATTTTTTTAAGSDLPARLQLRHLMEKLRISNIPSLHRSLASIATIGSSLSQRKLAPVLAVAGIALCSPVSAQSEQRESRSYPAELGIWSDPWLAEQMRPERKERGHDLREPEGAPPVSRGATYRTRPPSEWPPELPDDSQMEETP